MVFVVQARPSRLFHDFIVPLYTVYHAGGSSDVRDAISALKNIERLKAQRGWRDNEDGGGGGVSHLLLALVI